MTAAPRSSSLGHTRHPHRPLSGQAVCTPQGHLPTLRCTGHPAGPHRGGLAWCSGLWRPSCGVAVPCPPPTSSPAVLEPPRCCVGRRAGTDFRHPRRGSTSPSAVVTLSACLRDALPGRATHRPLRVPGSMPTPLPGAQALAQGLHVQPPPALCASLLPFLLFSRHSGCLAAPHTALTLGSPLSGPLPPGLPGAPGLHPSLRRPLTAAHSLRLHRAASPHGKALGSLMDLIRAQLELTVRLSPPARQRGLVCWAVLPEPARLPLPWARLLRRGGGGWETPGPG